MNDKETSAMEGNVAPLRAEAASAEPKQPETKRISTLVGDRLCITCGYNLVGQYVLREPHYDMLIIRCPECGTVASVQEYPLLGRWASRWGVVLAALWFLIVLLLLLVPPVYHSATAYWIAHWSIDPLVECMGRAQERWAIESDLDVPEQPDWQGWNPGGIEYEYSRYTPLLREWWDQLDRSAFLAESGGWLRVVNWHHATRWWIAPTVLFLTYGVVLSLVLPHVRRRWLPFAALVVIAVSAAYAFVGYRMSSAWGPSDLEDAAMELIGLRISIAIILACSIPLVIGTLLGRSLARVFIRAMLPPRLRGSLAGLWTCDGLDPPRGTIPKISGESRATVPASQARA